MDSFDLQISENYPKLAAYLPELRVVAKYVPVEFLEETLDMWNRPERYYHNLDHMTDMFGRYRAELAGDSDVDELHKHAILCAIVYHDAVYDVKRSDNEEESAQLWMQHFMYQRVIGVDDPDEFQMAQIVEYIIHCTKNHKISYESAGPGSKLVQMFVRWDLAALTDPDLTVLIGAERRILKEYQSFDYAEYREGRLKFLENVKDFILSINPDSKIVSLMQYVRARKLKVGIYAGTFYPMHAGHYSILKRAEMAFDKVIVACGPNPLKPVSMEHAKYVVQLRNDILPYHQVEWFDGLLTDYVQSKRTEHVEPTVIKGLGRPGDFDNEKMQMRYMEDMDPTINLAFFISDRRFDYVSSTGARIIKEIHPHIYEKYALCAWPDAEKKIRDEKGGN